MRLSQALRIKPGQAVAFTGAGGKSTAIRRLVDELVSSSPILITTTTRLGHTQTDLAKVHFVAEHRQDLPHLPTSLASHRSVLITGPLDPANNKWTAPDDDALVALRVAADQAAAPLLIEADGARGRSIKAPDVHEPAVPEFVDLVVPVAGLDAIGEPLMSEAVHRPELVQSVLGIKRDSKLGADEIAKLLTSNHGGLKRVPAGAEVRVLLNKADADRLRQGRQVAERILTSARVNSVLIGAVDSEDPVVEAHGAVAGIVLAAGGSSRLGIPKQLFTWRGMPLVRRSVEAATGAGLNPVIVVAGQAIQDIWKAIEGTGATLTENSAWREGQSGSVRVGLQALDGHVEAAVFLLADMPFVGPNVIAALVNRHRETLAPLVAPWAAGRRANPVLFDRELFGDLLALEGDQGGRRLFDRYSSERVDWDEEITFDLDTPEDLEWLRALE